MKKKLAMLLLALVMAFGGTSTALLTACNKTDNDKPGPSTTDEFKVRFLKEDGSALEEKTVKSGETVEAPAAPAKEGYTAEWVDKEGNAADFTKGITADTDFTVRYTAKTDVAYKVEYYFENTEGAYELDEAETKNLTGTTGATVTAEGVTRDHYTLDATAEGALASGEIKGDGSLVLKMYYKLDRVTVTFMADGETLDAKEVIYGGKATATDKSVPAKGQTVDKEFVFKHWSTSENGAPYNWNLEVTGALTLYAVYEETERTYYVTGDLADGSLWFLSKDVEGSAAWVDDEKYADGAVGLKYNEQFVFAIYKDTEVEGTAVVKAIKLNDQGEAASEEVLTATDGLYSITVDKNVRIEVTGLKVKTYELKINASLAKYEQDWAYKVAESEVVLAVTDEEGETTYHENALTGKIELPAGVYNAEFVTADGNGSYTTLTELEEFEVSADALTDGKFVVPGEYIVYDGSYAITGATDSWVIENGQLYSTGEGTVSQTVYFSDFKPGKADFVAMATFKLDLDKENLESDPTLGFTFDNANDEEIFPSINQTGMRMRSGFGTDSGNKNIGGLFPKYALGKATDAYDKLTEIVVKSGNAMYVFVTAERTDNTAIAKVNNKLIAVITKDALYACDGSTLESNSATAAMFADGINKVKMTFQMSNSCYGTLYGYAYSTEADIINSYLANADLTATVTVDGEEKGTYELTRGGESSLAENMVAVALPAGKIAKTVTVNGEAAAYEITEDGINVIVNAGFTGAYAINVVTEDGAYVTMSGTVMDEDGDAIANAKVTDGSVVAYTDANGAFTLSTRSAESYTLTVQAKGYKQATVKVTDTTATIEIELGQLIMGGSAILNGTEYGATGECTVNAGGTLKYEQGFDANGNETYTSVSDSGCRWPLMFANISSDKFIVKGSIKYNTVMDQWIRIGFIARDASGTVGALMYYGNSGTSNISSTIGGWTVFGGLADLPKGPNGSDTAWMTGKWEVAMAYDNGTADLYLRNTLYFGTDAWYHLYHGDMVTKDGTKLSGPVVVGMYETQNKNSSFVMSDFFASEEENFDSLVTISGTDSLETATVKDGVVTVKAKDGYEITDIKIGANSYFAQATADNGTYTVALPDMWMVDGATTVEVVTVEMSDIVDISGTVTVGDDWKKMYDNSGVTLTFEGTEGKFAVTAGEDGTYSVTLPKGTYTVNATNGAIATTATATVTGEATDVDFVLDTKTEGFYKKLRGGDFDIDLENDTLTFIARNSASGAGATDWSIGNRTFTPAKQTATFYYTLKGNTTEVAYPFWGIVVKEKDSGNTGRFLYCSGDAGDVISFQTIDDFTSRLNAKNENGGNLLWGDPWFRGYADPNPDAQWGTGSTYHADANYNLQFKWVIDGYKASCWIKGTAVAHGPYGRKEFNETDWVLKLDNLDIKAAFDASDKSQQIKNELYNENNQCYFGITIRQDEKNVDGTWVAKGAPQFADFSFEIADKQ